MGEKQAHHLQPHFGGGAGGAGGMRGRLRAVQLHVVPRAAEGVHLRTGGGGHEPAQRLYRPVLAGSGGLHAAGRVCLRHSDHPGGAAGHRVPQLRRQSGAVPDAAGAGAAGGRCGGRVLRVPHRPACAAAEERLSGHRHAGLCGDRPRSGAAEPVRPADQRPRPAEQLYRAEEA